MVNGLVKVSRLLGLREFVMAFLVMAFAASLPNLVVGISSGLRGFPELSFGDVSGNNLIALTLAVGIAAIFAKGGIPARSRMAKTTSWFVTIAALLPIFLILDGELSRLDGVLLILAFIFYIVWMFSKKERFTVNLEDNKSVSPLKFRAFFKDLMKVLLGLITFAVAAQGIVVSAKFFADQFNLSLVLIGILVTGVGSALPEMYFDVVSAKRGQTWLVLGDLMGAIIIPSTLVLGLVALLFPIHMSGLSSSSLALARIFIIVSALLFPILVKSGEEITKKEALLLLSIYIAFLIAQIFFFEIITNSGFNFLLK